jgi:hypothetical protein
MGSIAGMTGSHLSRRPEETIENADETMHLCPLPRSHPTAGGARHERPPRCRRYQARSRLACASRPQRAVVAGSVSKS